MSYPYPFPGAPLMAQAQPGWSPMMPPMYYQPGMAVPVPMVVQPMVYGRPPMIIVPPSKVLLPTPAVAQKITAAPVSTVYVGRIAPKIDDAFMNKILGLCGHVAKWTRISDPETQELASFGFCEYSSPQAALRALRILNDLELEGKKLLLNADKKTKEILEQYEEKLKVSLIKTPIDKGDDIVLEKINQLIQQRAEELKKAEDEADAKREEEAEEQTKVEEKVECEPIEGEKKIEDKGSDGEADKRRSRSRSRRTRDRSRSPAGRRRDRDRDRRPRRGSGSRSRERRARDRTKEREREKRARERARRERIDKERKREKKNRERRRKSGRRRSRSTSRSASQSASAKSQDSGKESKAGQQDSGADSNQDSGAESEKSRVAEAGQNSSEDEEPHAKKGKVGLDKAALFAKNIDWVRIEQGSLLETRVTPWVSARLADYFGEDSPDLVSHTLDMLKLRKSPEDVEKELVPVLTSAAEDFTLHLWKLLVKVCEE